MENVSNNRGRKAKRRYSTLSLNTTKQPEVTLSACKYDIKDQYEIIGTLGMGTYGYVRQATEKSTGRPVAIKTSRGTNSRELLKQEYTLLKRLADDNIVKVFDFIEGDKHESYLIMEYFEGETLDEFVDDHGPLSEEDARIILKQVIQCVETLHDLGIAHRDIKPENILVNDQMEVKLIDFNISKSTNPGIPTGENKFTSVFHTQISSPLYCAPELKSLSHYTESIDIWGLGVVLFTMLFGCMKTHSFSRLKTAEERSDTMTQMVTDKEGLSDECKTFLHSLLSKVPEDRPTASECLQNEWVSV
jgi:serine/threonine protein kinase